MLFCGFESMKLFCHEVVLELDTFVRGKRRKVLPSSEELLFRRKREPWYLRTMIVVGC